MRLRKRVKVLENTVASLITTVETQKGRIEDLEDSVDSLLKPVLEAFEKIENNVPTEKENSDELDYGDLINEYLNGKADK